MKDNISDTESVFEAYHRLKVQPVIQQRKDKKNRKKREANDSAASSAELGRQSAETLQKLDNRAIAAWKIQAWWRQKLDNKAKAIAAWKIQAWWRKRRTHLLPTNPYHARYRSEYTYFINGQEPSKLLRSPDRAKQRQVIEMLSAKSYDPAICQDPDFPYVVNALMCLGAEQGGITMEQGYTLLDIYQRQADDPIARNFIPFKILDNDGSWSREAERFLLPVTVGNHIHVCALVSGARKEDLLEEYKQKILELPPSERFFFVRDSTTVKKPYSETNNGACPSIPLYKISADVGYTNEVYVALGADGAKRYEVNLTYSASKVLKQVTLQKFNPEHDKIFTGAPRLGIQDPRDIEFAGRYFVRPSAQLFPEIKPFGSRGIHDCTQITYTMASAHDHNHTILMGATSRSVIEATQRWTHIMRKVMFQDIQTSREKRAHREIMTQEIWSLADWNVQPPMSDPGTSQEKNITQEFCSAITQDQGTPASVFFHHGKTNNVFIYLLLWDLLEHPVVWGNYDIHADALIGELKVAMDETVRPVFNALSQTTQQQQKPRLNMLQCILHRRELEKRSDGVNSPFYINWAAALSSKESDYLYSHLTFSRNGGEAGQQRNTVSLSFDFLGHKINVMDPLAADLIGFLIKMQRLLADSGLQDQDVVDSFLKETIGKNVAVLYQQQNTIGLQRYLSRVLRCISSLSDSSAITDKNVTSMLQNIDELLAVKDHMINMTWDMGIRFAGYCFFSGGDHLTGTHKKILRIAHLINMTWDMGIRFAGYRFFSDGDHLAGTHKKIPRTVHRIIDEIDKMERGEISYQECVDICRCHATSALNHSSITRSDCTKEVYQKIRDADTLNLTNIFGDEAEPLSYQR